MNPRYAFVAERAGHRCEYCRAPEFVFNFPFEIEHIIPPGHEGLEVSSNWALACRSCNLFKSDNLEGVDPLTQQRVALFHPRKELWAEHFEYEQETSTLKGLSAAARATIELLRLNTNNQIAARMHWRKLDVYPG